MFHTVYNSYESVLNGRDYIGKHSTKDPYDSYLGSYKDKTFTPDSKIVIAYSKTAEGAVWLEQLFQRVFDVVEDEQFANQAFQTSTGFDTTGRRLSEDHRRAISEFQTGRPKTEKFNERISTLNRERVWTEESKEKIRRAKTGVHLSEDHKQKISESTTGEKNPFFGRTHTEEAKQKIRDKKQGKPNLLLRVPKPEGFGNIIRNLVIGRHWFVNEEGETKQCREHPGEGWVPGRKWGNP